MDQKSVKDLSKFLSYILRHHPESIDLKLDRCGWAHIPSLIKKAQKKGRSLTRKKLKKVIGSGNKKRFSISDNGNYIRAGYGHSIDIDLDLTPVRPPDILYHGTARKNTDSIKAKGLHAGDRNFVHLSVKKEDAVSVGKRHGKPVTLTVNSKNMHKAGYPFYRSESEKAIWLVGEVPPQFIADSSIKKE